MMNLTKEQCISLIDIIESSIFYIIRNDLDIDSIEWLCNICEAYTKMKEYVEKEKNNG